MQRARQYRNGRYGMLDCLFEEINGRCGGNRCIGFSRYIKEGLFFSKARCQDLIGVERFIPIV